MRIGKSLLWAGSLAGLLLMVLCGCGNRGPLYLPQDEAATTASADPASVDAAQSQAEDTQKTDRDEDDDGGDNGDDIPQNARSR